MAIIASNLTANYTGGWSVSTAAAYGQGFTVPAGGDYALASIDVWGGAYNTVQGDLTLCVWPVANNTGMPVTGSALYVAEITATGLLTQESWHGFAFPTTAVMTVGGTYALVVFATAWINTDPWKAGYDTTGIHTGGINFRDTSIPYPAGVANTAWAELAGDDMIFRVGAVSIVPPSSGCNKSWASLNPSGGSGSWGW